MRRPGAKHHRSALWRSALRLRAVLSILALIALTAPAWSAKPDPSVGMEVQSPADRTKFLPGERIEVTVQITDPLQLVRHVFVRLAAPNNHLINGDQDASPPHGGRPTPGQTEVWTKTVDLPSSAVSGRYLLQVEALGDGNTPLQWKTLTLDVAAAKFGLRILTPVEGTVLSRNDNFEVTAQLDDPRRKARRVFVLLEDVQKKLILNGDREADRKGNIWIRTIHVPATAVPGPYRVSVVVYGEGRELLSSMSRAVTVSVAPVRLGDIVLDPPAGIHPGLSFQASAQLMDPRAIVRQVRVTVEGPNGKNLMTAVQAQKSGEVWRVPINLDEDAPIGNYTVQFQAVAQNEEVVATRRVTFPVRQLR
jgi:hypothetical protein